MSFDLPDGLPIPGVGISDYTFASIGDVNQDGYCDLLTGYPQRDDSRTDEHGVAWLIGGHPGTLLQSWQRIPPPTTRFHFGGEAAGVGDVNGDGLADFAVRSDEEVSVYLGVANVFPLRPVRSIPNPGDGYYLPFFSFGSMIGNAGDFNGDGRADLVVGASGLPPEAAFRVGSGLVFVYDGTSAGLSESPNTFRGASSELYFGGIATGFGDFNNDGFGDLVIGQPGRGRMPIDINPRLFVLPGSPSGASMAGVWEFIFGDVDEAGSLSLNIVALLQNRVGPGRG